MPHYRSCELKVSPQYVAATFALVDFTAKCSLSAEFVETRTCVWQPVGTERVTGGTYGRPEAKTAATTYQREKITTSERGRLASTATDPGGERSVLRPCRCAKVLIYKYFIARRKSQKNTSRCENPQIPPMEESRWESAVSR